jgi:hypothetical protein
MAGNLFPDLGKAINNSLGLDSGSNSRSRSMGAYVEPWDINKSDPFFAPQFIQADRWNRVYPYRLLVVDVTDGNRIVSTGGGSVDNDIQFFNNGTDYVITQALKDATWEFVLPITPQQLSIQDLYAINNTPTLRGIVEEHNGLKYKMITASGTTGILPGRASMAASLKSPGILGSLFAGTLENFGNTLNGLSRTANALSGKHPNAIAADEFKPGEGSNPTQSTTGYYQAQLMGQFIERYTMEKKKPENKGWRLVFDIPKQNQSFVVTPLSFTLKQSIQKPSEYLWDMQLKAWKRIELNALEEPVALEVGTISPNLLQKINNTLRETRRTLSAATNLVKAVRSDFQKPFAILRQTALAVKDLGGLAGSIADLPGQIIKDAKDSISGSIKTLESAFQTPSSNPLNTKASSGAAKAGIVASLIVSNFNQTEGLSQSAISNGNLGAAATQYQELDSVNAVFNSPEENFDLFDTVDITSVNFSQPQLDAIEDEMNSIRLININDLREYRQEILSLALDISNQYGAGSAVYNEIYGRPAPRDRAIPMTVEENEVIQALFEAVQSYDYLTASKAFDDLKKQNPLQYVGGLASEVGIQFQDYSSKIQAPVPFGLTIEQIAARYLGDPDKWIELVTLNALKEPYIDEVGFTYKLLSNAEGRQLNVNDTDSNLYVGQKIVLGSNIVPFFTRKIIDVQKIAEGNFLISVDGEADLDTLTLSQGAYLRGYLPGTTNSQNTIYIPVNLPAGADSRSFDIPNLPESKLNDIALVDFLLDDSGDVAINSVGDFRLASGLTNLIQALKLKIRTRKGSLLRHVNYGLGIVPGISLADVERGDLIKSLNQMIKEDARFDRIERLNITIKGTTLTIDMAVVLANRTGVLPITFDTQL